MSGVPPSISIAVTALGAITFAAGFVWEVYLVASQAWPTGLSWLMMGFGASAIALGLWPRYRWAPGVVLLVAAVLVSAIAVVYSVS